MTSYGVTIFYGNDSAVLFSGVDGAKVYNQILHKMDVHASVGNVDTVIPYHFIRSAMVSTTVTEDPEVTDAVCNETNS